MSVQYLNIFQIYGSIIKLILCDQYFSPIKFWIISLNC